MATDSTSSTCPLTLTLFQENKILPLVSIINVDLSIPKYFFPYIDFSTHIPNFSQASFKSEANWYFKLNFLAKSIFFFIGSLEEPIIVKPIFLNWFNFNWNSLASIVQPGVSALG